MSGFWPVGVASARPPQSTAPAFALHGNAGYSAPTDLEREIEAASVVYSQTYKRWRSCCGSSRTGATALEGAEVASFSKAPGQRDLRRSLLLRQQIGEQRLPRRNCEDRVARSRRMDAVPEEILVRVGAARRQRRKGFNARIGRVLQPESVRAADHRFDCCEYIYPHDVDPRQSRG